VKGRAHIREKKKEEGKRKRYLTPHERLPGKTDTSGKMRLGEKAKKVTLD